MATRSKAEASKEQLDYYYNPRISRFRNIKRTEVARKQQRGRASYFVKVIVNPNASELYDIFAPTFWDVDVRIFEESET